MIKYRAKKNIGGIIGELLVFRADRYYLNY